MTDNAELIERCKKARAGYEVGHEPHIFYTAVINALEAKPFDAQGHLRDGGGIMSGEHAIIFWKIKDKRLAAFDVKTQAHKIEHGHLSQYSFLIRDDWQPYHEPAAEGTREWAMEQDAYVSHPLKPGYRIQPNSVKQHPYEKPGWETGWSLHQEPREPVEGELRFITSSAYAPTKTQQYLNGEWRDVPVVKEDQ